jgi:hypothetical protein
VKKVLLFLVVSGMCLPVFSQETENVKSEQKNEIKINLLMTLFSFPDISYERIMSNSIGLGISAGFPLEHNDTKYRFIPYCRFYFGESAVKSFFIEANAAISGQKEYYYNNYTYTSYSNNIVDFGLGVSFGYKYVNSSGFIGELFLGVGRSVEDRFYPRVGISLGKLF